MYAPATATAFNCANDERTNSVPAVQAQRSDDDADLIRNAFEAAFHMSGVEQYLEYYQL